MGHRPTCRSPFRISVLATGGTIEKRYDAHQGTLALDPSVLGNLLAVLDQPDIRVVVDRVMLIDSLDMGDAERTTLADAVRSASTEHGSDAILVTHGTDTLAQSARAIAQVLSGPRLPIVLTGAMRPYLVADSDALTNVAQAIMAVRLLEPGVYAAFHGRVIPAAYVVKDYERLTLADKRG